MYEKIDENIDQQKFSCGKGNVYHEVFTPKLLITFTAFKEFQQKF